MSDRAPQSGLEHGAKIRKAAHECLQWLRSFAVPFEGHPQHGFARRERPQRFALQLSRTTKPATDNAVSIHIHRLRSRLQSAGVRVRTLRGFGYMLEAVGEAPASEL